MKTSEQLRAEFWAEDNARGGHVFRQYNEIKDVLAKKDIGFAQRQVEILKQHAIDTTEFYKNYKINDVFPVMNKMSFINAYEEHRAKSGYNEPTHIISTSGSTGTPLRMVQDYEKRCRTIADLKVYGELADYPSHERMIYFRGNVLRTREQQEKDNIFYIDCGNLGKENLEKMRKSIIELGPRTVFSYSSTLAELAKYVLSLGSNERFSLTSILVGGEALSDQDRKNIEEAFGCMVYRRYSDNEMGILAQDTGNGSSYQLNYGSYYFEHLKLDSDEPAEYGEVGRIVVTDLFNKCFPIIRYDTGDLGIMQYDGEGTLPYYSEVYGRRGECVYATSGDLVSPHKIYYFMNTSTQDIKQWQFIQECKSNYRLKINGDERCDYSDLLEKLKGVLGYDADVNIEFVTEIPVLASNKRRLIVCNYKK